jgi:hypothetical protein
VAPQLRGRNEHNPSPASLDPRDGFALHIEAPIQYYFWIFVSLVIDSIFEIRRWPHLLHCITHGTLSEPYRSGRAPSALWRFTKLSGRPTGLRRLTVARLPTVPKNKGCVGNVHGVGSHETGPDGKPARTTPDRLRQTYVEG